MFVCQLYVKVQIHHTKDTLGVRIILYESAVCTKAQYPKVKECLYILFLVPFHKHTLHQKMLRIDIAYITIMLYMYLFSIW